MFPFGFSLEELFYLSLILTVAGGYRETFLRASRNGGLFVGRAVGFIRQKREQVFASSAQRQEMQALQRQMSDALSELHSMRHNIRSAASWTPAMQHGSAQLPGGVAGADAASVQHHGAGAHSRSSLHKPGNSAASTSSKVPNAESSPDKALTPGTQADQAALVPAAVDDTNANAAAASAPAAGPASTAPGNGNSNGTSALSPQQRFEHLVVEDPTGHTVYIAGVPLIPVTAAAAGRAPEQRSGPLTGSRIAQEALAEQEVAHKAAQVLQGGPPKG